jgi:hypothetical protein
MLNHYNCSGDWVLRHSLLVHDHRGGEPALGRPAVSVHIVVGRARSCCCCTALAAAPDDHPDAVPAHLGPDLHDHLVSEQNIQSQVKHRP